MGYVLLYLFLSLLTGVFGHNTRLGFLGYFLMSLLITPLLSAAVLFFTARLD